ncbi:ribosome rescue protein RqcH [Methanobacterium alcaliphilum]|uniref:ribosome rescue protein RqcH n=1 Tax=Methanobacterium alcaliphilum TaxID=392018 RepID=UPI00200A8C5F|nr:ribosome rescue protein RqcH [Methanobacterium alcaliphilum]MCK9151297.1 NFACT family protein [Methanobacterium alcaliphilum]
MKTMSNVDIFAICHELNELLKGSRVDKSFQPTKDTVIIRFHVKGQGRVDVVFQAGARLHKTQYPMDNPKIPPSFPMLLRKYLKGGIVKEVKQHKFDRVVEITISREEDYTLVVELFAKGNVILLNQENQIILPLKRKMWSDRKITSKEEYKHPPSRGINPLQIEKSELESIFAQSDRDLIRTLARNGLGGIYAEEIVFRSALDKNIPANEVSATDIESIYRVIIDLFKPLNEFKFTPNIVSNGKEDVLPLELKIYSDNNKQVFDNYNEAADEFFSAKVRNEIKNIQENIWGKEVNKYAKRLQIQEDTLENFKKTIKESTLKGDLLYAHYSEVENVLNVISNARKTYSWMEISKILKNARKKDMEEVQLVESLDKLGNLMLILDETRILIDSKIPIPENAETYYEKAKKAKRKIKGVLIAIEKTKKELETVKKKKEFALERIMVPQKRVKKELKWYEKLRWFISSDDFLVIGGRDAHTNEIVVKKHMEPHDIYLHSDIHGAPSVIIKSEGREIPESTIQEAAEFGASFSSAWSKGFSSQDIYWVNPDQVSKTPQSGEFVAKGAFIIRGSRNYIRGADVMIAVGIVDYNGPRVMAGPVESLKKHSENYVIIKPGYNKKEAMAREILKRIDEEKILTLDDIIRVLPSGKCEIVNLR